MPKIIEVVYEDGVFKPLEKVNLKEKSRAKVVVKSVSDETFGIVRVSREELKKVLEELDEEWGSG
ncbi:MAG: antitoxin family protein [Euryarchaeota archaeon]|nr:antitoxin family protein [Euryarchaeota archaeon]